MQNNKGLFCSESSNLQVYDSCHSAKTCILCMYLLIHALNNILNTYEQYYRGRAAIR